MSLSNVQMSMHRFLLSGMMLILSLIVSAVGAVEIKSQEQADKLIRQYSQQITKEPDNAQLYLARADIYFKLHDFELAVKDYAQALKIDGKLDQAWYGSGMAKGRLGLIDEGIADLSVFIQRNPQSSLAYTKRGVRYLWKGDRENAGKDLRKAIALDPRNAEAHDDLGVILAQQGDYKTALEHFSRTVKLDPTYQKGYHNQAMAYYVLDRDIDALASVNFALQLDPESRNSMLLKSEILNAMGRQAEAQQAHEEAMFLPEGNWSERAPVQ
jgi:tetratricopeptide (TPR) repeat protein